MYAASGQAPAPPPDASSLMGTPALSPQVAQCRLLLHHRGGACRQALGRGPHVCASRRELLGLLSLVSTLCVRDSRGGHAVVARDGRSGGLPSCQGSARSARQGPSRSLTRTWRRAPMSGDGAGRAANAAPSSIRHALVVFPGALVARLSRVTAAEAGCCGGSRRAEAARGKESRFGLSLSPPRRRHRSTANSADFRRPGHDAGRRATDGAS
jgi:hypothetical protein